MPSPEVGVTAAARGLPDWCSAPPNKSGRGERGRSRKCHAPRRIAGPSGVGQCPSHSVHICCLCLAETASSSSSLLGVVQRGKVMESASSCSVRLRQGNELGTCGGAPVAFAPVSGRVEQPQYSARPRARNHKQCALKQEPSLQKFALATWRRGTWESAGSRRCFDLRCRGGLGWTETSTTLSIRIVKGGQHAPLGWVVFPPLMPGKKNAKACPSACRILRGPRCMGPVPKQHKRCQKV